MVRLANIPRIRALMARDLERHLADVAVLKTDLLGLDAAPRHRAALDGVRGYVPRLDLAALAALPEGTFGRAYATFMRDNGLSPFVLTDAIDDATLRRNAFGIRLATTHDMIHVLLGFDTSWPGELGVLAFSAAQGLSWAQRASMAFAWPLYLVRTGFRFSALRAAARRGAALGRRAPFLLGLRLEERFGDDLDALRRELRIA